MTKGQLSITNGDQFDIYVGDAGSVGSGGFNGGGGAEDLSGSTYDTPPIGGGGGGASDIRPAGATISNALIVGPGGGGGAGTSLSYTQNADTAVSVGAVGTGDSSSASVSSGNASATTSGASAGVNADGVGGTGVFREEKEAFGNCAGSAGGGGGGHDGGGGGNAASDADTVNDQNVVAVTGGGGGSAHVDSSGTVQTPSTATNSGDGYVEVTVYTLEGVTNVTATYDADDQITLSWDKADTNDSPDDYEIQINRDGAGWVSPAGGPATVAEDGSSSYSATYTPESSAGSAIDYDGSVGMDSAFEFRVRMATDDGTTTDWVSSDTVLTTATPPYGLSVTRPDVGTFRFHYTVQSDLATNLRLEYREDTGSGYGAWTWFDTVSASESHLISGSPDTKDSDVTIEYTVGTSYQAGVALQHDARYQFRAETDIPSNPNSADVYADYGNRFNVYFDDDFASGDASAWDATSGSATVTDTLDSVFVAGDSARTPETGGFAVEMGGAGYVEKSLGDLSGQSDVHVRVTVQTASNDNSSERGDLWWYDGSTWQTLRQWGWEYDGQGWMEYHAAVPASYLAIDNRIRVGRDEGGGVDYVAFDRVIVSDNLHEYTRPAAPTGLTLETTGEGEITYSFTDNMAIQEASRPFGDLYLDGTLQSKNGGTSNTITGLTDGEEYMIEPRVAPIQPRYGSTDVFWNSTGATSTIVTILPAPTNLAVDSVTIDSATISWTDNHDYGDTRVEFKQSDAGSWTTFSTLARNTETETVANLLHGELYDTRVVAQTEHTTTEDN
ncbi:fibronectin type III domain-containing protein [Natrinema soli]|uniref:fibronectin type III domain-containing protein n=1 Tax=Natrinema soli TaxID=1930624 RepID=UPI002361FF47|nr:fibronectin type III domain-containing protein [Natrinema soli]